jgi:hypothetical protein
MIMESGIMQWLFTKTEIYFLKNPIAVTTDPGSVFTPVSGIGYPHDVDPG